MNTLKGKAWKVGNHIDTDVIIPARYLNTSDPMELARYCMVDYDENFVNKLSAGDMIVAGLNFGCGSSREHAPIAIKAAGISCVIAENFARIFYRNAINIGLPILESPEASKHIKEGDQLEVDLGEGIIRNLTQGREYHASPFPPFMKELIEAGGLINYTKKRVAN